MKCHVQKRILVPALFLLVVMAVPAFAVDTMSGGFGADNRAEMKTMAKDYGLKLTFALTSGAYVGEVGVKVMDGSGSTVVDEVSSGPWFYADLGSGKYTVKATYNGKTVTRTVNVGGGQSNVVIHFEGSAEN